MEHIPDYKNTAADCLGRLPFVTRKQNDKASWDQVLDPSLFLYRCCPHTSTGEAPYTLVYNRDPPIPIHKLIKVVEPYMGEITLGKRIEQSRVSLSIAAKMLGKMRANKEVL